MADNRSESELFRAAQLEVDRHKWYASEKAGRDLGQAAVQNWKCNHWWRWCRDRLVEHLSGMKYWSELDQKDYGLINRDFHENKDLAHSIVERIKMGGKDGENLGIILWAQKSGQNMKDTLAILNLLDINSRRIACYFEPNQ
jgi:hypothetical protein